PKSGIFISSSYDEEFSGPDANNLESSLDRLCRQKCNNLGIKRNKARLVAQGYRQEEGIDYTDVFAPIARIEAIRLFLAFASFIRFMMYQMDVKSAFLYEKIVEESEFEMSSMGPLTFFLGLQVDQRPDVIFIHQEKPNIMFVVCAAARHQVTPKTSNLLSVKWIFKYLTAYPKLGLWYPRDSPFDLEAFSDSDYAGANGDRKSTTGGCQFLGRRLIFWQCKKQTIVATSSCEAEYVAAASCCG
nr:putative ribonuclease H-like domain-containing protein [Tanacetum cinerariifolium]